MKLNGVYQILGERIKLLRIERYMTQAALSVACNISLRRLIKLECAACKVRIDELCKLADIFGVPVDFLVGLTDERVPWPRSAV